MKIAIHYHTDYRYIQAVSFSAHLFRLFPKSDRFLTVLGARFETNQGASIGYRRDLFDNEIASCFYPGQSDLLTATLHLELEIQEKNAFSFLLDTHAIELPFAYTPDELRVLAPYLGVRQPLALPFWSAPVIPQATIPALVALNSAIHQNLQYERREEGEARPALETLALGSGACRDFAVLMAESLRSMGLAARLASGYVCELGSTEKRAEGALHAWVETYLPGAGWLGLDPTNGVLCNHNHITTAVGLSPADVSPIFGRYFNKTSVPSQMNASLTIHEIP